MGQTLTIKRSNLLPDLSDKHLISWSGPKWSRYWSNLGLATNLLHRSQWCILTLLPPF